MKGKIDRILHSWIQRGEGPHGCINIPEAAAEIAKLGEDTEVEIIEQYQERLDEYHAQLEAMKAANTNSGVG